MPQASFKALLAVTMDLEHDMVKDRIFSRSKEEEEPILTMY